MKLGMLSWNAPDIQWYFSCPFWEKKHSNNSQQRHFETNSCHCNISNVLYNLNCVRSVNHSHDATPHSFNGYRRFRADSCLTLTEREACERRPVRRLTERRASCPRMRRLPEKRANCTLHRLTGNRALWLPWPLASLSINGAWAAVLRRGYMSHWTEI